MGRLPAPKVCPYCGHEVVLTSNAEIYGKPYGKYDKCYLCRNCRASVGTHPNGDPLGILANKELKELKMKAHALFDPYWKERGWKRHTAYRKLSKAMGMSMEDCHFGHFDKDTLLKAISILEAPQGLYFK